MVRQSRSTYLEIMEDHPAFNKKVLKYQHEILNKGLIFPLDYQMGP